MNDKVEQEAPWARDLNEQQLQAVTAGKGPVLVVAGPGSGKTRVVTYRILYLIESLGVRPGAILAMTFTNKAAGEMKRRLQDFLGDDVRRLWVGTFHATCARLLRTYHEEAGVRKDFSILDEDDQLSILRRIIKDNFPEQKSLKASGARHSIERAKRASVSWEDFDVKSSHDGFIRKIYELYASALSERGALDFTDLILRAVNMLEKNEALRARLSDRFEHVLVDEFQDTDLLQYRFVRLLSAKHGSLFVVGDEDQSIYGWRGARVENIVNFTRDYPSCLVCTLERNYRSTPSILNAANTVIRHNESRTDKTLFTRGREGSPVRRMALPTEAEEADAIAGEIREFAGSRGSCGQTAVIYRVHAQSRSIEEAMLDHKIPYRIVGGIRFYERMEIKDLVGYLKLASNLDNDLGFERVLNVPPRGFGDITLNKIRNAAREAGTSLFGIVRAKTGEDARPTRKLSDLRLFVELIERLHGLSRQLLPSELLDAVVREAGYEDYLRRSFPENFETRLENIRELSGLLESIEEESEEPSLEMLFDHIALHSNVDALDPKEDRVTLMTAHSAKGLEFDMVVVAGVEEGLFPYKHPSLAMMSDQARRREIEEDCRLLYVAMTRARRELLLTSAFSRRLFGSSGTYQGESRFLAGIPDDIIRNESGTAEKTARQDFTKGAHDDTLKTGDRVVHRTFGRGKVIGIKQGKVNKLMVRFSNGSVKQIVETFLIRN
ncbi:MAG: UvrD-helicase domain-containing protein [Pseudomonadota bacterium]